MNWNEFIRSEKEKDYFKQLVSLVLEYGKKNIIYPNSKDVFNAFKYSKLDNIKVLILGQDPYINPNQAHGLAFSVPIEEEPPPSLKNIFKEIQSDLNLSTTDFTNGCLIPWAEQGVFLLNTVLTVPAGISGGHQGFGWETFTDNAIKLINEQDRPIVHMLWGNFAKTKKKLLTNPKHLILTGAHPSPLSCKGFFGGKYFSKANEFLIKNNIEPIDWRII